MRSKCDALVRLEIKAGGMAPKRSRKKDGDGASSLREGKEGQAR